MWENCTGFLVLDSQNRPVRSLESYGELFKAYVTWEEAYFRPAVVQKLSRPIQAMLLMMLRRMTDSNKVYLPEPKKVLDHEVIKMHKALTLSEETLNPIIERLQIGVTEINNLSLRISENGDILRNELLDKLRNLSEIATIYQKGLEQRAKDYEHWLDLLAAKDIRIRYSRKGALLTIASSTLSATLSGSALPLSLISLPFYKYLFDSIAGVRALKWAALHSALFAKRIDQYMIRINPNFDISLARLPKGD